MKKEKNKQKKIPRIFSFFNKITPLVDIACLWMIFDNYKSNAKNANLIRIAALIGIAFVLWRWGKAFYKVFKSKHTADYYLLDNRVIPICGKQRVGKSSLACYFAKRNIGKVFSNIPLRLKGKYTYKLTTPILTCREQVEDYSMFLVDEASLFYNNLKSDDTSGVIYGQAVMCQCVGHFFDGNIIYVSVDTNRLPKQIRDNYSAMLQVVGSDCYKYSFIGDALLTMLAKRYYKTKRIYTGLRIWNAQHYESIKEEQYISLLGNNSKENGFSPLYEFACFQTFGLDEYDDRYMKAYYKTKPIHKPNIWTSLQLNEEDFKYLYDSALFKYLTRIDEENRQKEALEKAKTSEDFEIWEENEENPLTK